MTNKIRNEIGLLLLLRLVDINKSKMDQNAAFAYTLDQPWNWPVTCY